LIHLFCILDPTIAAVFASLSQPDVVTPGDQSNKLNIDEVIMNAKTVNGLLNISDAHKDILQRKHALKVTFVDPMRLLSCHTLLLADCVNPRRMELD
jgi:hypothetical protein